MGARNTAEAYGSIARILHWTIALLLIGLVYMGLTFTGMERGPERSELAALHKSFALLTLLLLTVRLVWKFMNPSPAHPAGVPGWQNLAATLTHRGLYLFVYVQLTIGVLVAGQRPISFFGLFEFGPLLEQNREQHEMFEEWHGVGWQIIAVLVGLHVLAALYHHFVLKNDVLKRMTTG